MFKYFKLLKNKIKNQVKYPLSEDMLSNIYQQNNKCPDCYMSAEEYIRYGPSGGMSQNIKCSFCGSFFNDLGPFGLNRIHWHSHHLSITSLPLLNEKYKPHTPVIIQTWKSVYISHKDRWDMWAALYIWCNENCTNKWSIKSGKLNNGGNSGQGSESTFFFKNESEEFLALFKLTCG